MPARAMCFAIAFLPAGLLASGCWSGDRYAIAPVKGKILLGGVPATEGFIQFSPVGNGADSLPGKTAVAQIMPDGGFVLSTYKEWDGAVVGVCRVTADGADPLKPWRHRLTRPLEYEVKPSANEIVIDVQPDGAGKITVAGGG